MPGDVSVNVEGVEGNGLPKCNGVGNRRTWRKEVKKLQRKKRRQKQAKERDRLLEIENLEKQNDPIHKSRIEQQKEFEMMQVQEEEKEHEEQEEAWLRRELLAQQRFRQLEKLQKAQEAAQEALRLQREAEFQKREQAILLKKVEEQRLIKSMNKEFEDTMRVMDDYLTETIINTPPKLNVLIETAPERRMCEFFERTNCCRFGVCCNFNHKRPLLAKIIIIRNFFSHPLLKQTENPEYFNADEQLEFNEDDLKKTYKEFCDDVWPEIEKFGEIINFRVTRNMQNHLRGHTFVEYKNKRDALKAFVNLQGRYYACRRLCVEFSNIRHWRIAVCGLSLAHKCSKGPQCNYLHLFQNPGNKYNQTIEPMVRTPKVTPNLNKVEITPLLSWKDIETKSVNAERCRNWRWSESPEIEVEAKKWCGNNGISHKSENLSKPVKEKHKSSKNDRKGVRKSSKAKHKRRERNRSRSKSRNKYTPPKSELPHRKRNKTKSASRETSRTLEEQPSKRKRNIRESHHKSRSKENFKLSKMFPIL
uniref:Uncharacterized protein n=1 Tax=Glossina austeni TaxID=7395 RepID=A0A1A9V9Z6_GLOAU